jgi:hypothetical protein
MVFMISTGAHAGPVSRAVRSPGGDFFNCR